MKNVQHPNDILKEFSISPEFRRLMSTKRNVGPIDDWVLNKLAIGVSHV